MAEYTAHQLGQLAEQRATEQINQTKVSIMERLFEVAAHEGKRSYAINETLLTNSIKQWISNLGFTIEGNVISW